MKTYQFLTKTSGLLFAGAFLFSLTSCLGSGDESFILEDEIKGFLHVDGIPTDAEATASPVIPENEQTTSLPNATCSVEENENGVAIASINMTGVWDATNNAWLNLAGTGGSNGRIQNVWVDVDDTPKGIDVYNTADGDGSRTVLADLVFLVDKSGSMSEEANGLAAQIKDWSTKKNDLIDFANQEFCNFRVAWVEGLVVVNVSWFVVSRFAIAVDSVHGRVETFLVRVLQHDRAPCVEFHTKFLGNLSGRVGFGNVEANVDAHAVDAVLLILSKVCAESVGTRIAFPCVNRHFHFIV